MRRFHASHPVARASHAFSIIELLVVVSILALLIALLLPSLGRAREAGRAAVCGANQRQLHVAVTNYEQDNDGWLPASRQGTHNWVGGNWRNRNSVINGRLYPYVNENESIYLCPTFLGIYRSVPGLENVEAHFTYSMSEYVGNSWQGQAGIKRFNQILNTTGFLAFTDENPFTVPGFSNHTINNGALGVGAFNNPA